MYTYTHLHHVYTHTPEVKVFEILKVLQFFWDRAKEVSIETNSHQFSKITYLLRDMVKPIAAEICMCVCVCVCVHVCVCWWYILAHIVVLVYCNDHEHSHLH